MKSKGKSINLKQACEHLGISDMTMRRLLKTTDIPAYKPTGQWRFYLSELDDWIEESKNDQEGTRS